MVDPIPPEQWEQHKEEILRLYIGEDLPLRHVMKRVRTRDFHPDESQYRSKLKTWRQRKARKSRKSAKGPTLVNSALCSTDNASGLPSIHRKVQDSAPATEFASEQTLTLARLSSTWERSGELLQGVRNPVFDRFDNPDATWNPVQSSIHPSGITEMTATDPHPEAAYSNQQFLSRNALRRSVAEVSQCGPGQPRVERAVRKRFSNTVDKGPPCTRTQLQCSAGSGLPEPLDTAPAHPFGHHPPLILQYPPANFDPNFEWWQ